MARFGEVRERISTSGCNEEKPNSSLWSAVVPSIQQTKPDLIPTPYLSASGIVRPIQIAYPIASSAWTRNFRPPLSIPPSTLYLLA